MNPNVPVLVDRYRAIVRARERLAEEEERARAELLEALGDRRGPVEGARGAVRVVDRPTCRFPHARVVAALDEARYLREVATVNPARLRFAMQGNHAIGRAVAPFVEMDSYPFVSVAR